MDFISTVLDGNSIKVASAVLMALSVTGAVIVMYLTIRRKSK